MSKQSARARAIAVLACLLLVLGVLSALPATQFPAQAANASVSAGDVIFEQSPSGSNQNLIMQLHGTALTNLSSVGGSTLDHNPDVSPDGSRIAFQGERTTSDSPSNTGQAIVAMNSDGSNQVEVLPPTLSPFKSYLYPAWSPDGSKIALVEETTAGSNIAVVNADGSGYRVLTSGDHEKFPTWSPDGSKIAYESDSGSAGGQIYVLNASGTPSPHLVTGSDSGNIDIEPAWSTDGRIYFISSRSTAGIYYYTSSDNWATTGNVSIHYLGGPFENSGTETLKVSADGSLLAYSRPDSTSACNQIFTVETGVGGTTAGTTHQLTDTGCNDWNSAPTFVPASWPPPSGPTQFVDAGDSYAAGQSIEPFYPETWTNQNKCHRSTHAYGPDVTGTAGFPGESDFRFVACSGAVIANFYPGKGQYNETAGQLAAFNSDTKIGVVMVGGNDIQFPFFMGVCVTTINCEVNDPEVSLLIDDAQPRLVKLYGDLLRAAPRAQLYIMGYPHLFADKVSYRCRVEGLQNFEATWINRKVDAFNRAIQSAIASNASPRLHYVNNTFAFLGGEACSQSHLYMNELMANVDYSFHPTRDGALVLAADLAHAVRGR